MTAPFTLPLPTIAAQQFRTRQSRARDMVGRGGMTRAQASAHLAPWLAIACLCGADLPELADRLADYRQDTRFPISDAEARWLVAEDICPRARWVPLLAAARDGAVDRAAAALDDTAARAAAAALQRIAIHLAHDPNGHHLPPYLPRSAARPASLQVAA